MEPGTAINALNGRDNERLLKLLNSSSWQGKKFKAEAGGHQILVGFADLDGRVREGLEQFIFLWRRRYGGKFEEML